MANLAGHKDVYGTFSNASEDIVIRYDFAVDGGATSAGVNVFTAKEDLVIEEFYYKVETALASTGSLVVDCGIETLDDDCFMEDVTLANLDAVTDFGGLGTPKLIIKDKSVLFAIKTATATAGKIKLYFRVRKV